MTEIEDTLTNENEKLRKALEKIGNWTNAYPISIFPEPDMKLANETLKAVGIRLDAISASNMRYVLNGIKQIVDDGLGYNAELSRAAPAQNKTADFNSVGLDGG